MSLIGATEVAPTSLGTRQTYDPADSADPADGSFLPNFCDSRMVFAVVLVSEILALAFALVQPSGSDFLTDFSQLSVFMQWPGLTSAALICWFKHPIRRASTLAATLMVFGLVTADIGALSVVTVWFGRWLGGGESLGIFPSAIWPFALQNIVIGAIVTALMLRYFFVSHQWRLHVEAEARSRIDALQARIRPHFLFNSMNTIASLTRTDPSRAEEAVEDLADLFRATLGDSGRMLTLKEEFELTRIYQRIEMLRLGERLRVDWRVEDLPLRAQVPGLTVQPLLENAIYHGIERLPDGGTVTIAGRMHDGRIEIAVINPVAAAAGGSGHTGHRIAMQNIRERLRLAFAGQGELEVEAGSDSYRVNLRFPVHE